MRHISKVLLVLGCVAAALLFCGCSAGNTLLEDQLAKQSDVKTEEAWLQYESLNQKGELDEDGYYIQSETTNTPAGETQPTGSIHVTFARNAYLNVIYARDAEKTDLVMASECYLEPGDSLYLASLTADNPYSNKYKATGFRIYAYSDNGKRELLSTESVEAEPVLNIPDGFDKTELSIEPIGEYEDRVLTLSDYCFKEDGTQENLNGTWTVEADEAAKTTGDSLTISPVDSYNVLYDFSDYTKDYYYEKSTPSCIDFDDTEGTVQFGLVNSRDNIERYTVQLHRYITVKLTNNVTGFLPFLTDGKAIQEIQKNGEVWDALDKDKKEQSISLLKCGDKLVLKVAPQCVVTCEGLEVEKVDRDGLREFAVTIPQTYSTELSITVSKE